MPRAECVAQLAAEVEAVKRKLGRSVPHLPPYPVLDPLTPNLEIRCNYRYCVGDLLGRRCAEPPGYELSNADDIGMGVWCGQSHTHAGVEQRSR